MQGLSLASKMIIQTVAVVLISSFACIYAHADKTTKSHLLPYQKSTVQSWYAGIYFGTNAVNTSISLQAPLGQPFPKIYENNPGYMGLHSQLAAGSQWTLNDRFSVGIEADLDQYTGNSQHSITNFFLNNQALSQEKLMTGFSLFLLPRYHASKTVSLFAGPGITKTKFETHSGASTGGSNGLTGEYSHWLNGLGVKTGIGVRIAPAIDFNVIYQYLNFQTYKKTSIEPLSGAAISARYKPCASAVMAGLTFAFK